MTRAGLRAARGPGAPQPVVVPYGVRLTAAWTWQVAVVVAGVVGLLWLVSVFQVIVVPLLVAVLATALLQPLVELGLRLHLPRVLAVVVTVVTVVAAVVGVGTLVGNLIVAGFGDLADQAGQGLRELQVLLSRGPLALTGDQVDALVSEAQTQVEANGDQLVAGALSVTSTAGTLLAGLFLVVFALLFMLLDGRRIWLWLVGLLPGRARPRADAAFAHGWQTLTSYVRATVVVALVDAVGIGLGAVVLGIPLALPIAVLVFLTAFVPIVGAFASGLVAVLVALVAQGPGTALLMLGVVLLVQQLESQVLQPFLLGHAVSVHPLAVIVAIAAGVLLAGVAGALFAVPLVAVVNSVGLHLAGRVADDPALPDDPDAPLAPEMP